MLDREYLEKLAIKNQIGAKHMFREYGQNLILEHFYQQKESESFLFKGGTALKLVFDSPRYSEDLDFTGLKNSDLYENLLLEVIQELEDRGVFLDLVESKPTSGGHLSILSLNVFGEEIEIKSEISYRESDRDAKREGRVIDMDYWPAYSVYIMRTPQLLREKVVALLARQKPRDFFDLYFILRSKSLRPDLRLTKKERREILEILGEQSERKLEADLKELLPQSFHGVIADFPATLRRELR